MVMKLICLVSVGFATCVLVSPQAHAQKAQPDQGSPVLQDITAQFAAMERNIEAEYVKLIKEAKQQADDIEKSIEHLKELAKKNSASRGKTSDKEATQLAAAIAKSKEELRKVDAEIGSLEEKKKQALAELRKEKEKAQQEAAKSQERRRSGSR